MESIPVSRCSCLHTVQCTLYTVQYAVWALDSSIAPKARALFIRDCKRQAPLFSESGLVLVDILKYVFDEESSERNRSGGETVAASLRPLLIALAIGSRDGEARVPHPLLLCFSTPPPVSIHAHHCSPQSARSDALNEHRMCVQVLSNDSAPPRPRIRRTRTLRVLSDPR